MLVSLLLFEKFFPRLSQLFPLAILFTLDFDLIETTKYVAQCGYGNGHGQHGKNANPYGV
jgi:hypothetical protein